MNYDTKFNVGDWVKVAPGKTFYSIKNNRSYYVGNVSRGVSGQLISLYTDANYTELVGGTLGNKAMYFVPAIAEDAKNVVSNTASGNVSFLVVDPVNDDLLAKFFTIEDAESYTKDQVESGDYDELSIFMFLRKAKLPVDIVWEY
jgi:hypothetical protein